MQEGIHLLNLVDDYIVRIVGECPISDFELFYIANLLQQDSDGMYYVEYFWKIQSEFDDNFEYSNHLSKLRHMIVGGLKNEQIDIKIKYLWMAEKFNKVAEYIPKFIKELRDSTNDELADVLEVIVPIDLSQIAIGANLPSKN